MCVNVNVEKLSSAPVHTWANKQCPNTNSFLLVAMQFNCNCFPHLQSGEQSIIHVGTSKTLKRKCHWKLRTKIFKSCNNLQTIYL